jgi:branched-chain amino acid aminotransferase
VKVLWCNGDWISPLDFPASPFDRGLMHGLGLFETMLAIRGKPVLLQRHMTRLGESCAAFGWYPAFPKVAEVVARLVAENGLAGGRARIRLAVTAGAGSFGELSQGEDHLVWITAVQAPDPPPHATACLSAFTSNEKSPLAGIKSASYAEHMIALADATRRGFDEALFLNTRGQLSEASTANVFLVTDGVLCTPPLSSGCLPGITRALVMETAPSLGIPCVEQEIPEALLHRADEILLTSSIRGVMGVSRFGDRQLAPGPITAALRAAHDRLVCGMDRAGPAA